MSNYQLADRLKKAREKKGLKQDTVAEELKIARTRLSQYETGSRTPDVQTLYMLAEFYQVSSDWLLGLSDVTSKSTEGILAIDIGLSEKSILVLKALYDDYEGKVLLPILNYLIVQETPPPNGWIKAENPRLQQKQEDEYKTQLLEWEKQGYRPVLGIIESFFSNEPKLSQALKDGTLESYLYHQYYKSFGDIDQRNDRFVLDTLEHHMSYLRMRLHRDPNIRKEYIGDGQKN